MAAESPPTPPEFRATKRAPPDPHASCSCPLQMPTSCVRKKLTPARSTAPGHRDSKGLNPGGPSRRLSGAACGARPDRHGEALAADRREDVVPLARDDQAPA